MLINDDIDSAREGDHEFCGGSNISTDDEDPVSLSFGESRSEMGTEFCLNISIEFVFAVEFDGDIIGAGWPSRDMSISALHHNIILN